MKHEELKEAIFDMFRKSKETSNEPQAPKFKSIDSMLGGKMNLTAGDFAQLNPETPADELKKAFKTAYLRGNIESQKSLKSLLDKEPYSELKDLVDQIDNAKLDKPMSKLGASDAQSVRRSSSGFPGLSELRMQKLAGIITESEYNAKLTESYQSNIGMYDEEFKKRGFKRTNEEYSSGGYEDLWYKDLPLGRFCVSFVTSEMASYNRIPKHQQFSYNIFFDPYPKFEKKLFGLLKTKNHQFGKMIDFEEGTIDFGEGLFKIEDEDFIPGFFNKVDNTEKVASKITDVEYLSPEDSKIWKRTAYPDVN